MRVAAGELAPMRGFDQEGPPSENWNELVTPDAQEEEEKADPQKQRAHSPKDIHVDHDSINELHGQILGQKRADSQVCSEQSMNHENIYKSPGHND